MSAYYVFNKQEFAKNVSEVREAYRRNGISKFMLSYSFKTNSHRDVLQAVIECGLQAEVVSDYELSIAKEFLYPDREIVYNGVIPDVEGKIGVMSNGGIVNADNLDELKALDAHITLLKQMGVLSSCRSLPIGLRINIDVGNGINSRFGIEYGSDDYFAAIKLVESSENLKLEGVHNHAYGTRELAFYRKRVELMAKIGKELEAKYIDLGSGMYGFMDERLVEWFGGNIPTFDDYAKVTKEALAAEFGNELPLIVLELGTPLIANAIKLKSHVTNIKEVRGKKYVTLDCSMFDLGFTNRKANPPLDVAEIGDCRVQLNDVDLLGYTCMESDIVYRGFSGTLAVGDELTFSNSGAYTVALENSFIKKPLDLRTVTSY